MRNFLNEQVLLLLRRGRIFFGKMNRPDIKLDEYGYNRYKNNNTKPPEDKKEPSYLPIPSVDLYPSHFSDPNE
jgi:hypothetical protein